MTRHIDANRPIHGLHGEIDMAAALDDRKPGGMMFTREQAPTDQSVEQGVSVSTRDENALLLNALGVLPFDRNAVGRILAGKARYPRQPRWPEVFQAD